MEYKYVVVGAGLAGLTLAERIATQLDERVLVIEKRSHIGGNVYDSYNEDGILVHNYGPHTFHTNMKYVWDYLSKFTEWRSYQHRVMSYVDGRFVPLPISLETINALYNLNLSADEMVDFIDSKRVPLESIVTSEDVALSNAGKDIYEKFFKQYTIKQWGVSPDELDKSVISRIPFRTNRDTRYFTDRYQGQPLCGYTAMCKKMCNGGRIGILLNTDYKDVINQIEHEYMIYTGPVDYYFDYCFGPLKYRSVSLEFVTLDTPSFQDVASTRYPNDYDFTRITEFKKMTGQDHRKTTILREYPCDGEDPFYPFPTDEWMKLANKYRQLAEKEKNVYFVGRLAEYRYYDMDDVVARALSCFEGLAGDTFE